MRGRGHRGRVWIAVGGLLVIGACGSGAGSRAQGTGGAGGGGGGGGSVAAGGKGGSDAGGGVGGGGAAGTSGGAGGAAPADAGSDADASGDAPDVGTTDGATTDGGATNVAGTWYELGGSATAGGISVDGTGNTPALVMDREGHPIVVWQKSNVGAVHAHWNGTVWRTLGAPSSFALMPGSNGHPALALGGATPVVAWNRDRVWLYRWSGRAWAPLTNDGSPYVSTATGTGPSVAADDAGQPVVAWFNRISDTASSIYVRRWNGTAWEELAGSASGNGISGAGNVSSPLVAVDRQGNPIVAWRPLQGTVYSVVVKRWNGSAWEQLGGTVAADVGNGLALALDSAGQPVVAFSGGIATSNAIYVRRWNGTSWEELAGSGSGAGVGQAGANVVAVVALAVDGQGGISVAWQDFRDVFLKRWNGAAWQELGGSASPGGITQTPAMPSDTPSLAAMGNRICVAWNEDLDNVQLRCFDLAPSLCACNTTTGCDTGCACDPGCLGPNWDDFRCEGGAGFRCNSGQCVGLTAPCDGTPQCGDGSDESALCPGGALADVPRATCAQNEWACASGQCVFGESRCDGIVSCGDGSDEDAVCGLRSAATHETADATDQLNGLWAGPSGAWAAGDAGVVLGRTASGSWARQSVGVGTFSVYSIWGAGSARVYASWATALVIWDGANWGSAAVANANKVESIWGVDASDIWLVGSSYNQGTGVTIGATTFHSTSSTTFSAVSPGNITTALRAVRGTATNDVWAVGDAGVIVRWNGAAWITVPSNTTTNLQGVWAASPSDAWAVGDAGLILRWNGSAWTTIPRITQNTLQDVWGSSSTDVWAVGGSGTVLHWNGTRWTGVWSGTSKLLRAVYGYGGTVWASGDSATILRLTP